MDRGWHLAVPIPQAILAVCLIERGKPDLADTVLRSVEPTLPGPETVGLKAYFHWARGRLRLARADARGALEDFLDTARSTSPTSAGPRPSGTAPARSCWPAARGRVAPPSPGSTR